MTKTKIVKHILNIFLISVLFFSCSQKKDTIAPKPSKQIFKPVLDFRPNILWIVAEDMSPNIPAFGDSTVVTPALTSLAKEGICYDNFFSPHPVCSPARASIITGMYANSIGASHMRTGPWFNDNMTEKAIAKYQALPEGQQPYQAVPPPSAKMFTEYLRAAGYYCTNNSKEDYQFVRTMTSWDESGKEAHWRNRPKNSPFFSVFNIGVTHESQIWAKAKDSLWVDEELEVPVPPYLPNTEIAKKDIRRMYSNILEMDAQVGEIVKELEEDGLLDSTIVVWYTDHGGPLPRQKRLLYDSGTKVPMIVRFPNRQFAGQRDGRMVSFIDLAPTMLSLTGLKPPEHMHGTAFLGEYLRPEEPNYIFGAADRFDEFTDRIRSVRDKRFKYIKNYEPEKALYADVAFRKNMPLMQELLRLRENDQLTPEQALWFQESKPGEELYEISTDPHELKNLANNPEFQKDLERLRDACNDWVGEINDTGLRPENKLMEEFWPNGIQPRTQNPKFIQAVGKLEIHCPTEGASIGYRFVNNQNQKREVWQVYDGPIDVPANCTLEAIAHRLGYQRSFMETIEIGMGSL
jgi:arylsulfatase A-like enzyme